VDVCHEPAFPVVANGVVYVTSCDDNSYDRLYALNAQTGRSFGGETYLSARVPLSSQMDGCMWSLILPPAYMLTT